MHQTEHQQPAQTPQPKGLSIAALVTGGVAFLIGLVPIAGAIVGIAAICLAVIALIKKQQKVLAWIGLGLGGLATITCIIFTSVLFAIGGATPSAETPKPSVTIEPAPTEQAPKEEEPAEPDEPAGPSDEERAARFEQDLKFALFVEDSFQELLSVDPTLWGGYIADIRYQTGNIYVTLQVDGNTPDGKDLGQRAAQALSTLMTQETVDAVDYGWVIVEDGAGAVIDQKQPAPIM